MNWLPVLCVWSQVQEKDWGSQDQISNEEVKQPLCLGEGSRLRKPRSEVEGGLRETHGETDPAQLAQPQEKERKKWGGSISLAKHPLGLNPGLTPDHHNSLTIASATAWEIQSWVGQSKYMVQMSYQDLIRAKGARRHVLSCGPCVLVKLRLCHKESGWKCLQSHCMVTVEGDRQ